MGLGAEDKKKRGVYYTPADIAAFMARWIACGDTSRVLEPSCGDGGLIEALGRTGRIYGGSVDLMEIDGDARARAVRRAERGGFDTVAGRAGDFVSWAADRVSEGAAYSAIIGNPPFVRYHDINPDVRAAMADVFALSEIDVKGHANLWVAFLAASICLLAPKGRLAMVLPEELASVSYAEPARRLIARSCSRAVFATSRASTFENTLQGYGVLLAEKASAEGPPDRPGIAVVDIDGWNRDPVELFESARCSRVGAGKWTGLLLPPEIAGAYERLLAHPSVRSLGDLADVGVGIVTGANDYFLVDDLTVSEYGLDSVVSPMIGRSAMCPGLVFGARELDRARRAGTPVNFVRLGEADADRFRDYIRLGEECGLDKRYKCRVRKPWYRVPSQYTARLALFPKCDAYPRLVLNEADAFQTDASYRVEPGSGVRADDLSASFHNSLTALAAELAGRYYGGGVLELTPSEARTLPVPYAPGLGRSMPQIDETFRTALRSRFLESQDERLARALGVSASEFDLVREGYELLSSRRRKKAA